MSVPAVRVDAAAVYIRLLIEQALASRALLLL
jgi:hypothetical protein